jgi:hypothetical protein
VVAERFAVECLEMRICSRFKNKEGKKHMFLVDHVKDDVIIEQN